MYFRDGSVRLTSSIQGWDLRNYFAGYEPNVYGELGRTEVKPGTVLRDRPSLD